MIIREARPTDVSEIVKVLKASLGEADLPLSEEIWNFKHVQNPFGKSIALLAVEEDTIIGVRAFMRWEWNLEGKNFHVYRAVDTATHPEHRGKGIFKKLTLKAVEIARENGDDFIFNTPNDQSRPGYLKMGWQTAGKIKVGLAPSWNSFLELKKNVQEYSISKNLSPELAQKLCNVWNNRLNSSSRMFTPKTPDYLHWRYEINPLQKYEVFADVGVYLAANVRKRKGLKELRIVEYIFDENITDFSSTLKIIKGWCSKFGIQVISFSPKLMQIGGPSLTGSFGPILTLRDLNLRVSKNPVVADVESWSYSLGDLELF